MSQDAVEGLLKLFIGIVIIFGIALIVVVIRDGFRISRRRLKSYMEQRKVQREQEPRQGTGYFKGQLMLSFFLIALGWGVLEYQDTRASKFSSQGKARLWEGAKDDSSWKKHASVSGRNLSRLGIAFIVSGCALGGWVIEARIRKK